jgi:hypothetical protein
MAPQRRMHHEHALPVALDAVCRLREQGKRPALIAIEPRGWAADGMPLFAWRAWLSAPEDPSAGG